MPRRFASYAWAATALSVAVIAGGAIVRATGSGAGCGSHWPECNGSIIPEGTSESIIEFSHRATSGLAFLAVMALFLLARRVEVIRVRRAAGAALVFMVGEVAIGAALVLGEWVGDDASVARAVLDGFHLVNTLFLVGALTLTAWWGGGGAPLRLRQMSTDGRLLVGGLGAVLIVAAAGALTALGDTLFPDASIADDVSSSSHFLVRLRVFHPLLAVATAVFLIVVARRIAARRDGFPGRIAVALASICGGQLFIGFTNLGLGAPVWLQVVHLLVTNALWIALVLAVATELAAADEPSQLEVAA
jgi:heme A synthase